MKTFLHTLFFFLLVTQICFGQWYQQNSGTTKNLNAVHFIDENTGWAVGDSGTIIKTTDFGSSWNIQSSGTTQNLTDVQFVNANIGWIVGGTETYDPPLSFTAVVLKTIDGGLNWFRQISDTTYFLNDVFFVDENIGWAVGGGNWSASGTLLKTTNGGNDWISQSHQILERLQSVHFVDAMTGWVASGFLIEKTTDGGGSWTEPTQFFPDLTHMYSIYFINADTGWASGVVNFRELEAVCKTTDGGTVWSLQFYGTGNSTLFDIHFSDASTGWAVGSSGIYKTIDGGDNWADQTSGNWNVLRSVYFIDSNNGWAVGDSGTVHHTTNGGVSFVDDEATQPTKFILEQNFPNPFNSATAIQYSIPNRGNVALKIYDILGKEVTTLVNEEKDQGVYTINFDANNLASGLYLYRIQAGSFIETKKMILMK